MIVDLGETWSNPNYYEITNAAGDLADPDTVVYSVTLPDGTVTANATATRASTGQYLILFLTTMEGLHQVTVTATGGVLGSDVQIWRDSFTVESARLLVSVEEALAHLRATTSISSTTDREQLRWLCQVATDAVERDLGRTLVPRTVTETFDGGRSAVLLGSLPVITIATVTESGTTLADGWTIDLTAGVLYRGTSQAPTAWAGGRQNIVVTYRAGYLLAPPIVRKVALNGIARMWQTSQQAPLNAYADVSGDSAVFEATQTLTPLEYGAYKSLQVGGFA